MTEKMKKMCAEKNAVAKKIAACDQKIEQLDKEIYFLRHEMSRTKRRERTHRLITSAATIENIFGYDITPRIAERAALIAARVEKTLANLGAAPPAEGAPLDQYMVLVDQMCVAVEQNMRALEKKI